VTYLHLCFSCTLTDCCAHMLWHERSFSAETTPYSYTHTRPQRLLANSQTLQEGLHRFGHAVAVLKHIKKIGRTPCVSTFNLPKGELLRNPGHRRPTCIYRHSTGLRQVMTVHANGCSGDSMCLAAMNWAVLDSDNRTQGRHYCQD